MIEIGNIYPTTKDGSVEVISVAGNNLTVKFIDSGNIKNCVKCNLMKGMVSDKENRTLIKKKKLLDNSFCREKLILHRQKLDYLNTKIKAAAVKETDRLRNALLVEVNKKKVKRLLVAKFLRLWKKSCKKRNKVPAPKIPRFTKTLCDMYNKSVLVDFKDEQGLFAHGAYVGSKSKATRSYSIWQSIKQRSTAGGSFQTKFPWYVGTEVSPVWKEDFQEFARWYTSQIGYDLGWDIDKDALSDNKIYCPTTCIMLPREVNLLFSIKHQCLNLVDASKLDGLPRWKTKDGLFFSNKNDALLHAQNLKREYIHNLQDKYLHLIPEKVFSKLLDIDYIKVTQYYAEIPVLST